MTWPTLMISTPIKALLWAFRADAARLHTYPLPAVERAFIERFRGIHDDY